MSKKKAGVPASGAGVAVGDGAEGVSGGAGAPSVGVGSGAQSDYSAVEPDEPTGSMRSEHGLAERLGQYLRNTVGLERVTCRHVGPRVSVLGADLEGGRRIRLTISEEMERDLSLGVG